MKFKTSLAVAAVGLLAATGIARAETSRPYVMLGGGLSFLEDPEFSGGGTSVDANANNPGWAVMGGAGIGIFNNFRTELELAHRRNTFDPTGDLSASTLMLNFLYDIPVHIGPFTPYIGAGAGYGRFNADNVGLGGAIGTVDDSDWAWTYQGIAGVAAPLTNSLKLTLDYRYLSTFNDLEYRSSTGVSTDADYTDHVFMVGLRWTFGAPPPPAPVAQPAAAPAPAPQPAPQAAAPLVRSFLVFFDFDRSDITQDARKVINQAADNARKAGSATRITLTGHADRSGSAQYNMRLSQRRADAVKQELIKLGVPASDIVTVAKGESDPLVPTADGVREPRNRRVEIVF
jgi:outer membrane protein OmpA-like peptidoglycan-associated protein